MDNIKKILFVDDEPLSVFGVMNFLHDAGYDTYHVSNGKKAWKILNKNPNAFKVIIIDHCMPAIDGVSLLDMIKKSTHLNNIPVIIESDDNEDVGGYIRALEAGAFDYLYKPVEKNFLLYVVDNAVNDANNLEMQEANW